MDELEEDCFEIDSSISRIDEFCVRRLWISDVNCESLSVRFSVRVVMALRS